MAKSIRSKWRRKCRAVKRERYGAKELERLKKILGIVDSSSTSDVQMETISGIAKVQVIKDIKETTVEPTPATELKLEEMDTDKIVRVYNKRTMRDQFGNYPVWMNKRSIKKVKRTKKGKNSKKSN